MNEDILDKYPMAVSYKGEDVEGDWYIEITIPKQKNWYDTEVIAKEVRKSYQIMAVKAKKYDQDNIIFHEQIRQLNKSLDECQEESKKLNAKINKYEDQWKSISNLAQAFGDKKNE